VYANWENGVGNLLGDKPEGTGWEEGNSRDQEIKDTQTYGNRPISRYGHFFDETLEEESSVVNENQADLPELPPVGRNNDDVPNLPQTPIPEREINEFVQQFKNKRNTRSGEPIDELALKHLVGQQENVAKRSEATKSLMELATGSPENSGGIAIAAHGKGLPAGSLGPTDTNAFWIGFQNISKARGLESPMVLVVRDYHFPLRSGMQPSYSSYFYNLKKLTVDEFSYGRCVRVGKSVARGGAGWSPEEGVALGLIYNEVFHAYFDIAIRGSKEGEWIVAIMNNQTQYPKGKRLFMAEEAMSETINFLVDEILAGRNIPNYDTINKKVVCPGHEENGQAFAGMPEAAVPMSRELYDATVNILLYGVYRWDENSR
jgi:hypothetical protein